MGAGYFQSPIGKIYVQSEKGAIIAVRFSEEGPLKNDPDEVVNHCIKQLSEYFDGIRKEFDIPYRLSDSGFQQQVMKEVSAIPYGEVCNYLDIANRLGDKGKVRAVGNANGKNPILIILPCHRVIGSNGHLTGYAGGLDKKEWLLKHEGSLNQLSLF